MFLNLTMLAGIAGAVVPLVLHLLSRSRYRTVDWGAMMFLEGADARVMQSARVKQVVILLLRMGLVAGVAMALAQPVVRGRWGGLGRDGRVSAVIVLDCSASMGYDEAGKSRMELARGAVLNVLESLRENRAAILLLGAREDAQLSTPTTDLQALAQRVISLPEPTGRADLEGGLRRAIDLLDRTGETSRELYVVCDRQAGNWKDLESEHFRKQWRARLEKPGAVTRFFVVPVGSERGENLAIESVELLNPPAVAGQPAEVEVKVHNFGQGFRGNVDLRVEGQATTVSVGPDASTAVRLPVKFAAPGSRLLTATLRGSGLKFDDRMQAAVDVVEPIRVLVVSGDERGVALQNESDFVRIALAPRTADLRLRRGEPQAKAPGDPYQVDVQPAERWNEDDLRNYQVVVLANVAQVSPGQALALEQFVYEGGGLWIAPGNLTRAENYNQLLYRGGSGVMPVKLGPPTAEDGSEATAIQGVSDFDHPVFRFLKGRPDPIPLVTIGRYFPAEVRGRDARVLAQYASGKPFVVEAAAGRGRVLVVTTPLDADWGTLPLSSFYLPFVQSAVRYLTAGLVAERNLAPGEPIVARFGPGTDIRSATVRLPTGEVRAVPVTRGEVTYPGTAAPGAYDLRVEPRADVAMPEWARRIWFVVQTPTVESDLTALTAAQWERLSAGLGFERIDPGLESVTAAVTSARGGHEMWLTLVGVVICLGVVELAVVRRWSGGVA